jgi:hypothetical protein
MNTQTKTFRVAAISTNTNAFGLRGVLLVAQDHQAFEVGVNHLGIETITKGASFDCVVTDGMITKAPFSFEIPERAVVNGDKVDAKVWTENILPDPKEMDRGRIYGDSGERLYRGLVGRDIPTRIMTKAEIACLTNFVAAGEGVTEELMRTYIEGSGSIAGKTLLSLLTIDGQINLQELATPATILMILCLKELDSPERAAQWAYTLLMMVVEGGEPITIELLCQWFPMGFPAEDGYLWQPFDEGLRGFLDDLYQQLRSGRPQFRLPS